MKIAILSTFYPFRGGIAQFNANLYKALEGEHELKAFTFTRQYPNFLFPGKTQYVTKKDKAIEIESIALLDTINPFSYRKTAKAINAYAPDVLIVPFWMSFFGPSLGRVTKLISSKTIKICLGHNIIPHEKRFIDKPFTKYFLKQFDGHVVLTDAVKKELEAWGPEQLKSIVIPHPIYDHFGARVDKQTAREQLGLAPDKHTLLFFGFIRKYKGLDVLLEAFNLLPEEYQLIVAGEPYGSFDEYQAQIDNSPRKQNIFVFNDYIADDEVSPFFSASDVCVLPYKSATQSGISSIAMHFETPMIVTNVGGLKEAVEHDKNGLVVGEVDAKALAASIKTYFEEGTQERLEAGMKEVKGEYSWSGFAQKMLDFVENLK